jgi:hypothetical protein
MRPQTSAGPSPRVSGAGAALIGAQAAAPQSISPVSGSPADGGIEAAQGPPADDSEERQPGAAGAGGAVEPLPDLPAPLFPGGGKAPGKTTTLRVGCSGGWAEGQA